MGEIKIVVSVKGGFDYVLDGQDDGTGDNQDDPTGGHWEVRHEGGACAPCVANNDPHNIPFFGCNGNITRIDPDDGKGNLCRCKKVWVRDDQRNSDNNDF
jgi:hypothetical protein